MNEFVEKIVVYAPDKSSGHSEQHVGIYFRFNAASAAPTLNHGNRGKKKKGRVDFLRSLFKKIGSLSLSRYYAICKVSSVSVTTTTSP